MLLVNVSSCAKVITKQGISASKSWKSEVERKENAANSGQIATKTGDAS